MSAMNFTSELLVNYGRIVLSRTRTVTSDWQLL